MRQYTLNLDKKHVRPVVLLQNGITALLDTGAYIPVWTADEDILVDQLGAKFVCANAAFSGFGGRVHGNVYKVTINLNGILYPDMHIVAVKNDDDDYQMILSATMLDGLLYEIDTINHKLNITAKTLADTIRNLRIVSKEGKLFVLCNSNTNTTDPYEEILQKYCCNLTEQQKELVRTCTETLRNKDIELFEAGVKSCVDNL